MANISIYNVGESLVIQIYRSPLKLINMLLSFNGISSKIFLVVLYTFMRYFFCETVVYSHITENNWSLKSLFFLIEAPTQPYFL